MRKQFRLLLFLLLVCGGFAEPLAIEAQANPTNFEMHYLGAWGTQDYGAGAVTKYGGKTYVALKGANQNNEPDVNPQWWALLVDAAPAGNGGSGTSITSVVLTILAQNAQPTANLTNGGATLTLGIPAASVGVGTVTTLAPGQQATVTVDQASTATHTIFDFGIPQGAAGTGGGGGSQYQTQTTLLFVQNIVQQWNDNTYGVNGAGVPGLMNIYTYNETGGGRNLGPVFSGGWRGGQLDQIHANFAARGIHQTHSYVVSDSAAGDFMGLGYGYFFHNTGFGQAASDEGGGIFSGQWIEKAQVNASVATGGVGNVQPTFNNQSGNPTMSDGSILIDKSQPSISGAFNNAGDNSAIGGALPVMNVTGVTLPLTTAWGSTQTQIPETGSTPDVQSGQATVTLSIGQFAGGLQPFQGGTTCTYSGNASQQCFAVIAGPEFAEQVPIIAASAISNGSQTLTYTHHYAHSAGALLFQGGIAGGFIDDISYANATASLPAYQDEGGARDTAFNAFGSLTGTDLIYGQPKFSSITTALPINEQSGYTPTDAFTIYPGAEIVANNTVGLNPTIEPNPWPWTVGDNVSNPHTTMTGFEWFLPAHLGTRTDGSAGGGKFYLGYDGAGANGFYQPLTFQNNNPCSYYIGCGGLVQGTTPIRIKGPHYSAINMDALLAGGVFADITAEYGGTGFDAFDLFRLPCNVGYSANDCQHLRYTAGTTPYKQGVLTWDGDFSLSNWSGPVLNRLGIMGWSFGGSGNAADTPPYVQFCNAPYGGYGQGDTYVSLSGSTCGDNLGNLSLRQLSVSTNVNVGYIAPASGNTSSLAGNTCTTPGFLHPWSSDASTGGLDVCKNGTWVAF